MTETEKLLAVLDMTEERQYQWIITNCKSDFERLSLPVTYHADLAFRLRDEVRGLKHTDTDWAKVNSFYEAQKLLYEKVTKKTAYSEPMATWWVEKSKPIHWIVAALITKILAKKDK